MSKNNLKAPTDELVVPTKNYTKSMHILTDKTLPKTGVSNKTTEKIKEKIQELEVEYSIREDPASFASKNIRLYNTAIGILSLVVLLCAIGYIIIASFNLIIPESIIVLGTTAVGALAGILLPSSTKKEWI